MSINEKTIIEAFDVLNKLENMGNARKGRVQLLEDNQSNSVLKTIFELCYDWQIQFKNIFCIEQKALANNNNHFQNWNSFLNLIEKIKDRIITSFEGFELLKVFLRNCNETELKWYSRIIERDLSVGVSWAIINKIWPGMIGEWWLAATTPLISFDEIEYPVSIEPYISGIRLGINIRNSEGVAYSDKFRKYPILDYIIEELTSVCSQGIFDGVLTANELDIVSYYLNCKVKSINQIIMDDVVKKLVFCVIDFVEPTILHSSSNFCDQTPYLERKEKLKSYIGRINSTNNIVMIPNEIARDKLEAKELYNEFIKNGFKGIVLKSTTSPYSIEGTRYKHFLEQQDQNFD